MVVRRNVFRPGVFNYTIPPNNFFAPGTRQSYSVGQCLRYTRPGKEPPRPCAAKYWLHLFARAARPYWDTRLLRNGQYDVRVTAWDARGNTTSKAVDVTIRN